MSLRSIPAAASTSKSARVAGVGRQANRSRPANRRGGACLDFDGQQPLQGNGEREALGAGLIQHRGQGFGGGRQFELGQMRAQLLIATRGCRRRLLGGDGGGLRGAWSGGHWMVLFWAARS